ncbi:MAG: SusC/RagA family TonB-linked outer membrane protein [Bacteroidaceae bacterium]|nr:SusC/RagA family TonB-linked outer membrane protein [Bacteroidaceae bacterium]
MLLLTDQHRRRIMGALVLVALAAGAAAQVKTDSLGAAVQRVGYMQASQTTLAGAVDQVGEDRMKKGLVTSSLDALSGQAAGVQVQTGGNQEAMVSAVRVRGTTSLTGGNDPLVIIDGVTADLATLSSIYPADIESFTILKDASETAQYGSRGAAGVIQVATKRGQAEQFHISYDGNIGFEAIYKNVRMLGGDDFRSAARQLGVSIVDKGGDTNFPEAITRTGFVQNHHIAFGGGSEKSFYRASLGLMDHRTVIETYRLRNYIAKLDISQKAFDDRLTVDLGVFGSIQKNSLLPNAWKLFYSAATFNPTFPDGKNAEGGYDQVPEAWWINNPNSLLEMQEDEDNGHFSAHLRMAVELARGLSLTAFGSYSYNSTDNANFYPTFVWSHGEAYRGNRKSEELLGDLSLHYARTLAGHHELELLGLLEAESERVTGFYTTASDFTTNAYGYDNLSAGALRLWEGTNSYYWDSRLLSFLARAKYTYRGRYSLTVNARADGSSKVGENHRWGFFPSMSGAWIVSDEAWMKGAPWINSLKLRAGYGLSGNLGAIDSYLSQQLIQPNGVVSVGGTPVTTLGVIRNANPDLQWEVKRTFNVGLDMAFWNKRVVLTVDYYRSKTSDMLYEYDVPVPPFTYDKLLANLGSMENGGVEIGFGITPLRTRDLELSINMNWAFERNKLISLNGDYNGQYLTAPEMKGIAALYGAGFHGASDVVMQIVGEPLGVFYLPHCNGLVKAADGSYYYDVTDEKYVCGQATPKATMGSNIALRYRQWDITLQMNGAFGHKIYNGTKLVYMNMLSLPNYNVMEGAPERNIQDQTISDYWLERGDYLNIDYVTLGWNVPLRSKYIQGLRLSASVNNLATITGYSGLTPMINSSVVSSTLGVDDKRNFPVYRSYAMNLSVKF